MKTYSLNVGSHIIGGYFSSEQIDFLSIIQCQTLDELIRFITDCDQINRIEGILESISGLDLESAKRKIFKYYQDTMAFHDEGKNASMIRRLNYLGLKQEEIESVISGTHVRSEEILLLSHHFVSKERDQIKSDNLYDELLILNSQLSYFNCMLIGSGRITSVVNRFIEDRKNKFDFYYAKRDLDFAYKNGKQVRYHSLLVKDDCKLFDGKSKEQIMELIKEYVKESIDFINSYNSGHKISVDGKEEPIINAVDLFNEIVSFDKNEKGEYYNIWEERYGIALPELISCFDYALKNKSEGVSYLYNEPFLENDKRRHKVLELLSHMPVELIDTLGSQMHITIRQDIDEIKRCFEDFKKIQDNGMKIQITEFDMSLGRTDIPRVFGPDADVTLERVYQEKDKRIQEISDVINDSKVKLSGVTYWSLTDGIDCNLERIRSNALSQHLITDIKEIPTACGGWIPTYKEVT